MSMDQGNIESYLQVQRAHGPAWSPDSRQIAFVADISGLDQAWLRTLGDPEPKQLTDFPDRVGQVSWSPAGEYLLVTVDAGGNEHDQLYLLSVSSGETRALTQTPDVIHNFGGWSPDGQSICYSSNQRHPAFFDVWTMNVFTGEMRCILQQDASLMPNVWSPDGTTLVVTRLQTEMDMDLLLVYLDGRETRLLTAHTGEAAYEHPCFAPDGRTLYVLSNYEREFMAPASIDVSAVSEEGVHAPMTYLVNPAWDAEAGLALSPDGKKLAWALNENGRSRLVFYDLKQAWELTSPAMPAGVIEGLTWSPKGMQVAFSFNGTTHNGNIWIVSVEETKAREPQQITSIEMNVEPSTLVEPELIHYPSFDGLEIPAYYYRPRVPSRLTRDGLQPVIVFVHGGPESQFRPLYAAPWMPPFQYYLNQGFAILAPNVRGSSGYGKTYVHLDDVGLRPNSVADLKAGVEWLIREGKADPKRIGIMGRSYGGYMVLAAITVYPELWAAAVDMVGIANFVSFLENTGPWRRKWREGEYGSLEHDRAVLEQISPINSVDKIITPLLVLHGANDPRVPVGEAEQIVAALKARQVPVEFLRFPNEGHFMLRRDTQLTAYPAASQWFDRYMS
jgi:dipeptidyl aminopeptidase/acylaminoacyl peptidase